MIYLNKSKKTFELLFVILCHQLDVVNLLKILKEWQRELWGVIQEFCLVIEIFTLQMKYST
jgi:hypothetical protein